MGCYLDELKTPEFLRAEAKFLLSKNKRLQSENDRLRQRVAALESDREVARIMALSDDEVIAETIADGLDPHEEAEKCRAILRHAIAAARGRESKEAEPEQRLTGDNQ